MWQKSLWILIALWCTGCATVLQGRTVTVPLLDIPFNSSDNLDASDVDANKGWYKNRAWRK